MSTLVFVHAILSTFFKLPVLFLWILVANWLRKDPLTALLPAFVVVNALAFVAFGFDKLRAQYRFFYVCCGGRMNESALLLSVLFGGYIGALAGRRAFRHKTVKRSFTYQLYACIACHCVACAVVAGCWFRDYDNEKFLLQCVYRMYL
eukprot:GEMP01066144.1.p1 GENE.GEMP01066144.1~~GEMP01066144.1.p1  ORF type:complete len:148 (+),score=23.97 GEMP01066144.1:273-716(+)